MIDISHAEASANILQHVEEGRITQNAWHDRDRDGREIACLLGSIHPSVTSPAECNGKLMPMWLAELTPTLFDGIPDNEAAPIARRYGHLVARWHALSDAQWESVLTRFLIRCIDDAVAVARPLSEGKPYWPAVEAACRQCRVAIESRDRAKAATTAAAARAAAAAWAARAAATEEAPLSLFCFLLDQIEAECNAAA